jgi:uncharacterized membrane protein
MGRDGKRSNTRSSPPSDGRKWAPGLSTARLEALTDGVFAIAMTILVLELSVPDLMGGPSSAEHPASFGAMWEEFYVYVVGFLALGIYWILHKYMFHFIKRSDGVLAWLNIVFLIMAALVPFSTKVLLFNQELVSSERTSAGLFFEITTISTILLLLVMWRYATHKRRLVDEDLDMRVVGTLSWIIIIGVGLMVAGIALAFAVPLLGLILSLAAMVFMIGITAYGRYLGKLSRSGGVTRRW